MLILQDYFLIASSILFLTIIQFSYDIIYDIFYDIFSIIFSIVFSIVFSIRDIYRDIDILGLALDGGLKWYLFGVLFCRLENSD